MYSKCWKLYQQYRGRKVKELYKQYGIKMVRSLLSIDHESILKSRYLNIHAQHLLPKARKRTVKSEQIWREHLMMHRFVSWKQAQLNKSRKRKRVKTEAGSNYWQKLIITDRLTIALLTASHGTEIIDKDTYGDYFMYCLPDLVNNPADYSYHSTLQCLEKQSANNKAVIRKVAWNLQNTIRLNQLE